MSLTNNNSHVESVGALYVHIPFCVQKCAYCDFASSATCANDPAIDVYLASQLSDIRRFAELGLLRECKTAYIGGGTPTILGTKGLMELVGAIRNVCPQLEELTFEANPDTLDDTMLTNASTYGATRVSIGVQSLEDIELKELRRVHDAQTAQNKVRAAVASGLDVSVDLMCAIPEQTDESWQRTLLDVVGMGVDHVSVYPLAIEEGTEFGRLYLGMQPTWNDEEVQARRMIAARDVLEEAGYCRYEVASYAKQGKRCLHNIAYWTGITYLGLGTGAASMLNPRQYELVRSVYCKLPHIHDECPRIRISLLGREVELLSSDQATAEDLMLGMRLVDGVASESVPASTRAKLIEEKLARTEGNRLVPTTRGWLLGNELYGTMWDIAKGEVQTLSW